MDIRFGLDAVLVRRTALALALILSLASLVAHLPHGSVNLLRVLSVDDERSLPSLWSCIQLLVLAACAALVRSRTPSDRRAWTLTTGLLLLLAVDEGVSLHETTIEPLRAVLDPDGTRPLLTFAWIVPAFAALLLTAALARGFVGRMDPRLRRGLLAAAALYVLGGLGFEAVGGAVFDETSTSTTYIFVMHLEELLEMTAVALAIGTVLQHAHRLQRS